MITFHIRRNKKCGFFSGGQSAQIAVRPEQRITFFDPSLPMRRREMLLLPKRITITYPTGTQPNGKRRMVENPFYPAFGDKFLFV